MKIITSQDFIQIRSESMISSSDLDFLFEATYHEELESTLLFAA